MDFIKGTEIKFAINLTAEGFSMDSQDFDIEVASPRNSVIGYKGSIIPDNEDVLIFKDTSSASSGESGWFCIVDTSKLEPGELRVIATAHVLDAKASGGVRNERAKAILGKLVKP